MKGLVYYLILGLILSPTLAVSQENSMSAGPAIVKQCYFDYVSSLLNDKEERERSAIRARCLTSDFNRRWQKAVVSSGADALLLAQDALESWTSVSAAFLKGSKTSVSVELGTGSEKRCLLISFDEKEHRISSVKKCAN